ncbi:MAG: hypothetical protein ACYC2R_15530 [Burkholderiales bacterium]
MITCKVSADVANMRGKSVLVFVRPQQAARDVRVYAWQVLDLSGGATASFVFDHSISVSVLTKGTGPVNPTESERVKITPGTLKIATRPAGLSPQLAPSSAGMAAARLTTEQAGVYNDTNPCLSLDCTWFVSGQAVATMPDVDWGMTCTFEYQPVLYFMIAAPLLEGENFTVQSLTGATPYPITLDTAELDVRVRRERGRWRFSFHSDWQED